MSMDNIKTCPNCGYILNDNNLNHFFCENCEYEIIIETQKVDQPNNQTSKDKIKFNRGDQVILYNEQHPLHLKTGTVFSRSPGFHRIEIDKNKIWVPNHWLLKFELLE